MKGQFDLKHFRVFRTLAAAIVLCLCSGGFAHAQPASDIHDVARRGSPEQAMFLLSRGYSPDSPDPNGLTPLMYAAWFNPDPDVAKVFLDAGARIDYSPGSGWTAARLACWNENPAVLEFLVKRGADLSRSDEYGTTPLMLAARYNANPAVIASLVRAGSRIGDKTSYGWTAFMFAAESNPDPAVLDILLDSGADIDDRDETGRTVWFLAASANPNPEIFAHLQKKAFRPDLEPFPSSALPAGDVR